MSKFPLAIGSIFRDESRYMREWLEYHLMVGVDHFYLLQNDDEGSEEFHRARVILKPYMDQKLVSLKLLKDRTPYWQLAGWAHLLKRWGQFCDWIALIDLDVFMNPVETDWLPRTIAPFDQPHVAVLAVYYTTFGDSGLEGSPELQIESFVCRAPLDAEPNYTANYIMRPERMEPADTLGYQVPKAGYVTVDTDMTVLPPYIGKRQGPQDKLRLHHYGVRSRADWRRKVARGWPETARQWFDPNHKHEDHKLRMLNRNDEHDTSMHRFVPQLKERLAHGR